MTKSLCVIKYWLLITPLVIFQTSCFGGWNIESEPKHPAIGKTIVFTVPVIQMTNFKRINPPLAKKYNSLIELAVYWDRRSEQLMQLGVKAKQLPLKK